MCAQCSQPHSHTPEHSVPLPGEVLLPLCPPAQPGCSTSRKQGCGHAPTLPAVTFLLFTVPFVSSWGQRLGRQDTADPTPPGVPWRQRGFHSHPQGNKWVAQDLASGLAPGMPHPMHTPENTKGTCFYQHSILQMPLGKLVGSSGRKLRKSPPLPTPRASFQQVWALSPRSSRWSQPPASPWARLCATAPNRGASGYG